MPAVRGRETRTRRSQAPAVESLLQAYGGTDPKEIDTFLGLARDVSKPGWWLSPPRPGLQRLIYPWEYRHIRAFGLIRVAGGSVAAAAGVVCLSYGVYGWAFFLVVGALSLAAGYWYLTIARSASART